MDEQFIKIPIPEGQKFIDRNLGLGGSDCGTILGMNKFGNKIRLWQEKTGKVEQSEINNDYVYWGNTLEKIVLEEAQRQLGVKIETDKENTWQSKKYPFMLANIDGYGTDNEGKRFIFEAKTCTQRSTTEWEENKIPIHYYLQVVHYLIVSDFDYAYIGVLIGGNDYRLEKIEREKELEKLIIAREKEFWEYVTTDTMPPVDADESVEYAYPLAKKEEAVVLPETYKEKIQRRAGVVAKIKELEKEKEEIEYELKRELGEHKFGECENFKITWSNVVSNRLDTKALQNEHKEIYEKYLKPSSYRRFAIKELKA